MHWVTRARPKIDRIACPWLIAKFIDEEPEFLFVPAADVLKVAQAKAAIPYDILGVELGHEGDLCSFDAFLKNINCASRHCNNWRPLCARRIRGAWI